VYFHNQAYAYSAINGPILVRARDVITQQTVVFVSEGAVGPVFGTDTLDGQLLEQHTELVLYTDHRTKNPHPFVWSFIAGVPTNWSGETGWQIDGPGFSEVFLAC